MTTTYYINKAIIFDTFRIIKAHIIDDDCNEYEATIKGDWICRGYEKPENLDIIDLQPYNKIVWETMQNDIEYTKAKRIV